MFGLFNTKTKKKLEEEVETLHRVIIELNKKKTQLENENANLKELNEKQEEEITKLKAELLTTEYEEKTRNRTQRIVKVAIAKKPTKKTTKKTTKTTKKNK